MFISTDVFYGATAPSGSGPPSYPGFTIILRHTTLYETPQPDTETFT